MARSMRQRLDRMRGAKQQALCESLSRPAVRCIIRDTPTVAGVGALMLLREARMSVGDGANAERLDALLRRTCQRK